MFIGRENELNILKELYEEDRFQLVIMYGRRRVGKTSLITEFCKNKSNIFYVAQEYNNTTALKEFSERIMEFQGLSSAGFAFESWEAAFTYLGKLSEKDRIIVAIDEFPYLSEANKSVPSILQNVIDHVLKKSKLFLILCGSSMAFMEKEVLSYESPLYGRRTAQMKIEPFDYYESSKFFSKCSKEQQLINYGILGGIPQYLLEFDEEKSLESNLRKNLVRKSSFLFSEPLNLLKQELREPMVYNSIIGAIAQGASKLNDIAQKIGEKQDKCALYIRALDELGIIAKHIPAREKHNSRKGIYSVSDYLFRFWFRFIYTNMSSIEIGLEEVIIKRKIIPQINHYMGHVFEDICRQFLIRENRLLKLPILFTNIGSWWGNNPVKKQKEEIDIVAYNEEEAIFAECKWKNELMDIPELEKLIERSRLFSTSKAYYILFSKSGFTDKLRERAALDGILLFVIEDLFNI